MVRTGRPPKATEQKKAEGTLRAGDAQTPFIVGGREKPEPPDYLTSEQTVRFNELVDELHDAGYLDKADGGMLALIAIEETNVRECNKEVDENGVVVEGAMGGPVANPAVTSRAKSLSHLRQLYAEVGIGPASRARFRNLGMKGREPAKTLPGTDEVAKKREELRKRAAST